MKKTIYPAPIFKLKKWRGVYVFLTLSLAFASVFSAQAEVSGQTVSYLLAANQSVWTTQALAAIGETDLDISYLDDFEAAYANQVATAILAIVAAGGNPYDYQGADFVAELEDYYENGQLGSSDLLNDDFWGIMALDAAGLDSGETVIREPKGFILDNQNEDGGWSYSPGLASDSNDTAAAIMALLSAGLSSDAQPIQSALEYLSGIQNEDGGFGFSADSDSDSGSTAWVVAALNKLNLNPEDWQVGDQSPLSFLDGLYQQDGSYLWLTGDEQGSLLMTSYVAVALFGSSYPVAYYQIPEEPEEESIHHLRIEGPDNTLCDNEIVGNTVLEVIENGAEVCGYDYHLTAYDNGLYLDSLGGLAAEGLSGWQYLINWQSSQLSIDAYQLSEDDHVLLGYGSAGLRPLKVNLSNNQVSVGEEVVVSVQFYNGTVWQAADGQNVQVGAVNYQTDQNGQLTIQINTGGLYPVYAEAENYVRSQKEYLKIGSGVSRAVELSVNVNNQNQPPNNQDTLSFMVNTDSLDFGSLNPGGMSVREVSLTNNGNRDVYLETQITGDSLFADNLYLDNNFWENFNRTLPMGNNSRLSIRLQIPNDYPGSGAKQGSLIFWGTGD
jgi:hypothetical protein